MTATGASSGPRMLRLPTRSRAVPTATRFATSRAPAVAVPLLAVLLGGGVVVAAQATGHWATTGRDAISVSADGGGVPGSGSGADTSALPASPDEVKGWMTLQQVLDAGFPGVTEAGLREQFRIPVSVGLTSALKDLDGLVAGFDVAALRTWLAAPE
jgi:hypothetical protein